MLFEHNPVPTTGAGVPPPADLTQLDGEERVVLGQGLGNCTRQRPVDRLAQRLLEEWDVLSAEERATSLGIIGTLLVEAISSEPPAGN